MDTSVAGKWYVVVRNRVGAHVPGSLVDLLKPDDVIEGFGTAEIQFEETGRTLAVGYHLVGNRVNWIPLCDVRELDTPRAVDSAAASSWRDRPSML